MHSLFTEYRLYLQAIYQLPKLPSKMFVAKFGLITFEFLGVFAFLWTIFDKLGDFKSIVLFLLAAGYGAVRLYFTYRRGKIDIKRKELEYRKELWEQAQREKQL